MIKAMANLIRPATDRRPTRHNKSKSPQPLPAAAERDKVAQQHQQQQQQHRLPIATSTRRSSRTALLPEKADQLPIATIDDSTPTSAVLHARTSRKRSASALADAPNDTRPPTKITITQPHGELLRITNGVPRQLGIAVDELPSGASTPTPNGSAPVALGVPTTQTPAGDKRSLRSQDGGSRLKSDLAIYFASYDDVIAGVVKPPESLDVDTPIYLVDEPLKASKPLDSHPTPDPSRKSASPSRSRKTPPRTSPRKPSHPSIPPSQSSTSFQPLNYTSIAKHLPASDSSDPLADAVYFTQHRRAERKEKQLRNIEKERAMHEKVQLERLLDGLQGPDWLKVMGITGVTDGERKEWEPKRDFFVREVEALVDKFRMWKEQEKRVRAEREALVAAREGDDESDSEPEPHKPSSSITKPHPLPNPHPREPETPKPRRPPRPHGFLLPFVPPEPTTPFTSFYSKPHLRTAALGKHRHGRNATAFGLPIPEAEEHVFALPEDFVTPEFLRDNARKRRRRKRESGVAS